MKAALLVIDVQKAFYQSSPQTIQSLQSAVGYINAAIALFRKKNLPVVCVQHIEGNLTPDVDVFGLPEDLAILPTDVHIHKTYGNSFNKTPLYAKLQELDVDTVIITGYCAEYCVLSTCRGAEDLDLTSIILRGSLASDTAENIGFVERVNDVISYGALKKLLS